MRFYEQIESGIEGQDTIIDASAISNLPELVQANWNETDVNSKSYILNKPSIPKEFTQQQVDWDSTSGVTSILNKPTLAEVATSGDYNDLSNTPTIPAAQVQANWNETNENSMAFIKNKPSIPKEFTLQLVDWNSESGVTSILNKPNLAAVATSGDYKDLTGTPTIQTLSAGQGITINVNNEIVNTGVRSVTLEGNIIKVNTYGSISEITIPDSGKIDNISFNEKNLTISDKTVTLPTITLEAWDTASDNKTTFTIVGQKNN